MAVLDASLYLPPDVFSIQPNALVASEVYHVVIITDIHVHTMGRQLERYTGNCAIEGSATAGISVEDIDPRVIFL
jgi:hypothetical protein